MKKNTNKKIGLLLAALSICISNADAQTIYKVTNVSESLPHQVLDGQYRASFLTTWNFDGVKDKVYCITPGGGTPKNGTEYVQVNLEDKQAAIDYVCSQIKNAPDYEKGAILKLAAVKYLNQQPVNDQSAAYSKFFDNKSQYVGETFTDKQVRDLINNAAKAKSATSKVSASQNGNKIEIESDGVEIEVSVSGGYSLVVNGANQKASTTTLKPTTKTKYTIKVAASSETEDIKDAKVTIKYDQKDAGTSTVTATMYKKKESTNSMQSGVSCNYNGASNKCDTGFNANGNSCENSFNINEEGKKTTCKEPTVSTNTGSTGSGLCDLNGNTVVEIKENFSVDPINPTDDELYCIKQHATEATELAYGTNNDYCKVYCTENISLILPGPDANNSAQAGNNDNVFINAGSFFTIEGDKKQTNDVSCYSVFDYNKYQNTIYGFRESVVNAYNTYSKALATKNASKNITNPDTGIITCELSGNTSYKVLSIDSTTGKITSSNRSVLTADCNITDQTISGYKNSLSEAITNAKSGIQAEQTKWNACFDFNIDKVLDKIISDCDAEITFKYGESECGDYKLVKDATNSSYTKPTGSSKEGTLEYANVGVCDMNGDNCNKNDTNKLVKYISLHSTVTIKYEFDNDFTINLETGEVSCDAQTGEKYSEVYNGFPVKQSAVQAKYEYNYYYTGIGHDLTSNACNNGRFDSIISKKSFGCYFDVNSCKECTIKCKDSGCSASIDVCDSQCKAKCVGGGCIVDGNGGLLTTYKSISLNNEFALYPMSQDKTTMLALVTNPNAVSSTKSSVADGKFSNWDTIKGQKAESKILSDGEGIYSKDPEYSVTLTPKDIENIKKYNASNGAYANAKLNCINYSKYNYGICTSDFIHNSDFSKLFSINTSNVDGLETTTYNGVLFASYTDTATEFVGPAWK